MSLFTSGSFPPPRAFQQTAHDALRQGARDGHRCQLIMAPTGAGKTYLGHRIANEGLQKGKRVMFVCDRITLIDQTSKKAHDYGLPHGIVRGGVERHPDEPYQIASIQTLARITNRAYWPKADVVIIDEAHTTYSAWTNFAQNTDAHIIGLSATPFTKGLGKVFSNLINATTIAELTSTGVLVPMIPLSARRIDMTGAKTSGGEWTDKEVEQRGIQIVADVVDEWLRHGQNRKTICFGATIRHCQEIVERFAWAGVSAASFTADTGKKERDTILDAFSDGTVRVLVSVEALAKGFDVPDVSCVIDCRPLRKSLSTAIQMWGRGLRSAPDKTDCILLDHSGNIRRFQEDYEGIYHYGLGSLDAGEKYDSSPRKERDEREDKACPKCQFKPFSRRCMRCGFEYAPSSGVTEQAGEMERLEIGNRIERSKTDTWRMCVTLAKSEYDGDNQKRLYAIAASTYQSIFRSSPPKQFGLNNHLPLAPDDEVRGHRLKNRIAYAKSKHKPSPIPPEIRAKLDALRGLTVADRTVAL